LHCEVNNPPVGTGRGSRSVPVQIAVLLCAGLLGLAALHPVRAQGPADEYQVKAAFLFHFAQLVEWPAGGLNTGDQSINLCIFDDEQYYKKLQDTIEGKRVGTRVLHVRVLDLRQNIQSCNMLFLSRAEGRRQAAILKSARDLPILTVGETDDFLADGGMIHFRMDGDKIRFDINANGADASHLRISSRLLLLATSVTLANGASGGKASDAY
jgi:YfiR/HmsC-like